MGEDHVKGSTIAILGLAGAGAAAALLAKRNAAPAFAVNVGAGIVTPRELRASRTFTQIGVARTWDTASVLRIELPQWARRASVTMRVEVNGRRLELDNTKTYFSRCGAWQFTTGNLQAGVDLGSPQVESYQGWQAAPIPGCGDGQDDAYNLRKYYQDNNYANGNEFQRQLVRQLAAPGTPWWVRARASMTIDRAALVVDLVYPRDVAANKDGGPYRGNKYNVAIDYVVAP